MKYKIVYEKRKTIKLGVSKDGNIEVFSPFFLEKSYIDTVVKANKKKIEKLQSNYNYNKNIIKNFTIENNILLFGKIYKTRLCEKNTKISFNEVSFFLPSYEFSEIKSELKKTYKKQLSPILEEMVEKYYKKLSQSTTLIGISKPAFKINSAQTRWGSCSCKKDVVSGVVFSTKFSLNFSFMLAMLDFEEIEAIVAHEICHILVPNHSKDFYDILLKIFPEYNEIEKKLSIDQKQPHLQIWKEN